MDTIQYKLGNMRTARPLCSASETINMELNEYMSHVGEAALAKNIHKEVISTEDLLAKIYAMS